MDDPDLDGTRHREALRGLARLNTVSRSAKTVHAALRRLGGRLRVLDLAAGGGDVTAGVARLAGPALSIEGCDRSPRAVSHARARAPGVRFFVHDVVRDGPPPGYDVYVASLFLHHLAEDEAVRLLRGMAQGRALLVNDLRRSRAGHLAARVVPRLLTRSPVVHADARRSVENAFSLAEARALAEKAGLGGATVARRWPFRFLLAWSRP